MIRRYFYDLRQRVRHVMGPCVGIAILGYFLYHVMQGDRGLLAMMRMNQQLQSLHHELAEVTTEREYWEHRTRMLRPESIDPDMLNEVVRRTLGYVDQDDVILPRPLMISDRRLSQQGPGSQAASTHP